MRWYAVESSTKVRLVRHHDEDEDAVADQVKVKTQRRVIKGVIEGVIKKPFTWSLTAPSSSKCGGVGKTSFFEGGALQRLVRVYMRSPFFTLNIYVSTNKAESLSAKSRPPSYATARMLEKS